MAGVVHIPWYSTGFRGDRLERALIEIASIAPRYGATGYAVYRGRDDRYRFLHMANFEHKIDFERYWHGPEMVEFRTVCAGWFQVPIVYAWHDLVAFEQISDQPLADPAAQSQAEAI